MTNVEIMIPFVRTVDQAKAVVEELARQGLKRGENGLKIIMMCEIPSNALLASSSSNISTASQLAQTI
ncbi:phosphoenolpyruvate synthase [Escherichia coli ECA-0157]|nr:phosphoenolpyruvate synthase [Escherichia coli ECA-0157]